MTNTEYALDTAALTSRVIAIIAEQEGIDAAEISPTSKLEDLGLDSLDAVGLAISLEEVFDIEIAEESPRRTVGDVVTAVRTGIWEKDKKGTK